jgi:hypothetical protein
VVLDWVAQVHGKGWSTAQDIGDLVYALNDIFDLQRHLCGWGRNLRLDATKFLQQRYGAQC